MTANKPDSAKIELSVKLKTNNLRRALLPLVRSDQVFRLGLSLGGFGPGRVSGWQNFWQDFSPTEGCKVIS